MRYQRDFETLKTIDPIFREFARKNSLIIDSINHMDFPERTVRWISKVGLRCTVQIFLNQDEETFQLWTCAAIDKDNNRYWKRNVKVPSITPPFDKDRIQKLLTESFFELENIKEAELEFATSLGKKDPFWEKLIKD